MDERKESSIEKEKDHKVNNRMAKRKKSPIEKYDEVKNRADERKM